MQTTKRFLPVSSRPIKEVIVEFLGSSYVFYRGLASKETQKVMLGAVAKEMYCFKIFDGRDKSTPEIIFYETDGNNNLSQTARIDFRKLSPEKQTAYKKRFGEADEVTDFLSIYEVMLTCQQAYMKKDKSCKKCGDKF